MVLKRIFSILRHPTTIKIVGVLVIVGFFFILPTFAAGVETQTDSLVQVQKFLNDILKLCSWGRVILAILAGKLMTNDRVYGSILHMDIYLRKIWNIMKNFANFMLIGLVLFQIIKNLVGKKDMDLKSIITKTLIAGILIQASRFLVGALVDVSTIATSAIGAFPSTFLKSDTALQKKIKDSLSATPKRYLISITTGSSIQPIGTETVDGEAVRDKMLPTYNSVSGPLLYLGFSVFRFQDYLDASGSGGAEALTISFLLRVVLILMYTIGLALLFIANIIRVAFLRIFIIAFPLIILSWIFFKDKGVEGQGGIGKYLKFSVMVDLIFKPVVFVAGFSLILILVVSMQSIMQGTLPKNFNGVTLGVASGSSTLAIEDISYIEVKENGALGNSSLSSAGTQVKEVSQSIFVNLLLFFLTTFLMRQFIKISATSGKGPVADVMGSATKTLETSAKTLPIVPFGGGASFTGAKTFMAQNRKKLLEGAGVNERGEFGALEQGGFKTQNEKFRTYLNKNVFNLQEPWSQADRETLDKIAGSTDATAYDTFFTKTQELAKSREGGLSIVENQNRFASLQKLLSNPTQAQAAGFRGAWTDKTDEGTKSYFSGQNLKNLYTKLGGDPATGKTRGTPPNRDELKSVPFYATKATGSTE